MLYLYKVTNKGLKYFGPGVPKHVDTYGALNLVTSKFKLH